MLKGIAVLWQRKGSGTLAACHMRAWPVPSIQEPRYGVSV